MIEAVRSLQAFRDDSQKRISEITAGPAPANEFELDVQRILMKLLLANIRHANKTVQLLERA